MSCFFNVFIVLVVLISVCALNLKVVITQSKAVIDAKPIINLNEIKFYYNGIKQFVGTEYFIFSQTSSGYPETLCNDDNMIMGTGPYNMCKSGNQLATQKLTILTSAVAFNSIKVNNAYGFNNPSGQEIGKRIEGATLQVLDVDNANAVLYSYTFSAPFKTTYDLSIPYLTAVPSRAPTSVKPSVSFTPTLTRLPTPMPTQDYSLLFRGGVPTSAGKGGSKTPPQTPEDPVDDGSGRNSDGGSSSDDHPFSSSSVKTAKTA